MEKEYTVIANTKEDLPDLEAEITASSGAGPIPNRSVDIVNPRLGSRIQTHFMLTDDEAEALRSDPRVRAVEIPPDQRDDITIGIRASQLGAFERSNVGQNTVNWGLRRCIDVNNNFDSITGSIAGNYNYALDGSGVDVVIQDSGIQPGHPEWEDSQGNTRLQQLDWYSASGLPGTQNADFYRDRDGHGTHVAGIAAGKTYGWAKGARIYAQKLAGLETLQGADGTGIPISDAFDSIRLWHISKAGNRPTVVNMSWGYLSTTFGNPTSGVYRGTPWNFNPGENISVLYGLPGPIYDGNAIYPAQVVSVDAEIEDMIDAGIHICIAAGNDFYKADIPGGNDYDNNVLHNGNIYTYHRPGSPYSNSAFFVGNIDNSTNGGIDRPAASSKKGPAVNVWAPGTEILSTASELNDASYGPVTFTYPLDSNYSVMNIGGTSMSSPQVAGLLALYLQSQPTISPNDLLSKIINDSSAVISDTGLDNDYTASTSSLMGSPNRMLYSRYGVANTSSFTGSLSFSNLSLDISNTSTTSILWVDDNGDPVTVSGIISSISMQLAGVFAVNPTVPINIEGRSSGAATTITNISANTGSILEVDDDGNSTNFIIGESLNIIS